MTLSLQHLSQQFGGRAVRYYAQTESTNDDALAWAREGAPVGALVVADDQVRGRGRLQRAWYAPPETALMFSMVMRPDVAHIGRLTMLGALAVCETLEALGVPDVGIKWSNDVRIGALKICGVLPEAAWQGDQLAAVVLGIGVNVRIDFSDSDLATKATSLEPVLGRRVDRLALLAQIVERVDDWALQLGSDALFEAWRRRLVILGRDVTLYLPNGGEFRGVAESVDNDGALMLRTPDGQLQRFIAGEVTLRETPNGH